MTIGDVVGTPVMIYCTRIRLWLNPWPEFSGLGDTLDSVTKESKQKVSDRETTVSVLYRRLNHVIIGCREIWRF